MKHIIPILFILMILPSCTKSAEDRTIPFEGIENARDLGGLKVAGGKTIKPAMLIRSGHLGAATDADVALLKERFALSDVFDFRFDAEAGADPDRVIEGVNNTRLSTLPQAFIGGFSSGRADTVETKASDFVAKLVQYSFNPRAQELGRRMYPAIVMDPTSQKRYGEFLRGVLSAKGGVLWHCSQGKDRAGWATAFVLAALGADRRTIVDDFNLSNVSYASAVEKLSEQVTEMGGGENELSFIRSMIGVSVENFESALDLIDESYGSMDAYLEKALGFGPEDRAALRKKLCK